MKFGYKMGLKKLVTIFVESKRKYSNKLNLKKIAYISTGLKKLVTIFVESKRKYSNKLNLKKIAYISFSNLLGTVYRKGNIIFTSDGNTVICPVGNKISLYNLANNRSITLPIEARYDYTNLALSPGGHLLIASQSDGEIHVINLGFKKILYKKKLKGIITCIKFSPNGKYFAVAKHRKLYINNTPSCTTRVFDPFSLRRSIEVAYDDIISIDWSQDSNLVAFGSRDMTVHVHSIENFVNFKRYALGGHNDSVVGNYFLRDSYDLCTVTKNGIVNLWNFSIKLGDLILTEKNEYGRETELEDTLIKAVYKRRLKLYLNEYLKTNSSLEVTSTAFKKENFMLVIAFSTGDFLLMDVSDSGTLIHSLNMSSKSISSICLNPSGDWIAVGAAESGELLVWEWQSETHVLKQQGHFNNMRVVAYSPDSLYIATGSEDGKVKIWSCESAFCVVTFKEHSSEVTGVVFTQSGRAVITSSLDGTVRAFDMIRYRNFKTLTSPTPAQFKCLSVDTSGELIAAGAQDSHNIYLWSLQTGKLLEILGGHAGPVVSLSFSPVIGSTTLVSTSWDRTVKIWDAIANTTSRDTIAITSEGACVAFRVDGEQIAVSTMDGHITTFNTKTLRQEGNLEGRNDLSSGRSDDDKTTAKTNLKTKFFTTLNYSTDGKFILAAGRSKNVCIYSLEDELLIKKFQVTQNRSLGAMDKIVNRNKFVNGVNISLVEKRRHPDTDVRAPGSVKSITGLPGQKPEICVTGLAFNRTGRSWSACTTEGLLIYSIEEDWLFDPLELDETNTPSAVKRKLLNGEYSTALMMACKLNLKPLIVEVIEKIPLNSVKLVINSLSPMYVESLIKLLPSMLESSRHIGLYSEWVKVLLMTHGAVLKQRAPSIVSELSYLYMALNRHYENLGKICNHNEYTMKFLLKQSELHSKNSAIKEEILHLQPIDSGTDSDNSIL